MAEEAQAAWQEEVTVAERFTAAGRQLGGLVPFGLLRSPQGVADRWLLGTVCLANVAAMSNDLPGLRASHADRDRVVDALRVAAGDGRLSAEELDTRLESALSARTLGELAGLTADLPIAPAAKGNDVLVVEQHGGRYVREGRWPVPARIELRTQECRVTLDFTHAVITSKAPARKSSSGGPDVAPGASNSTSAPAWLQVRRAATTRPGCPPDR